MLSDLPDLAFSTEITTVFYRQLSSNFPMSSNPIHIDSSRVVEHGVEVVWSYYDRYWEDDRLVFGMRFTIVIDNEFWLEQQEKLLSPLAIVA